MPPRQPGFSPGLAHRSGALNAPVRNLPMRPCGPTTKGSERAFQLRSASVGSCSAGLGWRAHQVRPSSVEMSVPLGPTGDPGLVAVSLDDSGTEPSGWIGQCKSVAASQDRLRGSDHFDQIEIVAATSDERLGSRHRKNERFGLNSSPSRAGRSMIQWIHGMGHFQIGYPPYLHPKGGMNRGSSILGLWDSISTGNHPRMPWKR